MTKISSNIKAGKHDVLDELLAGISEIEMNRSRVRMRIAANIFDILKRKKIQNQELASRLKKQPSEITRWLSGAHNFTTDTLSDIAFALNVRVEDLVSQKLSDVIYRGHFMINSEEISGIFPTYGNTHFELPSLNFQDVSPLSTITVIYFDTHHHIHLNHAWTIERLPFSKQLYAGHNG